jgi:hypothetical protein
MEVHFAYSALEELIVRRDKKTACAPGADQSGKRHMFRT